MRKIYLLLVLVILLTASARGQILAPAVTDSITQSLNQQFPGGHSYTLWRVEKVRQQLEGALFDQQLRTIPMLLGYLTRTVPDTVTTVQPREALSLLLAAGAYGPLLQRVLADKSAQAQRRYQQAPVARPSTLADIADFYTATHIETLTALTQPLSREEAAFIRLLLEVLPRGGVSPAIDSTIRRFGQQYPNSPYGYVLKGFQTQEAVKAQLRKWHVREEREWQQRREKLSDEWIDWRNMDGIYGVGTALFAGALGRGFRFGPTLVADGEVGFGRYLLSIRAQRGAAELLSDFSYEGITYPAGTHMAYVIPEFSVGYRLVQGKWLGLAPFIGAAISNFGLPEQVPGTGTDGVVVVHLNRPLTTGLIFDIAPNNRKYPFKWIFKVRAGLRSASIPSRPDSGSTIFYLNAGLGVRLH